MGTNKQTKFNIPSVGVIDLDEFDAVESSNLDSYLYNGDSKQLIIRFKKPGDTLYIYNGISSKLFLQFSKAESKGAFIKTLEKQASSILKAKLTW